MNLHNQSKPGPKEGPYDRPAAGPTTSRVPTHTHPIPAEWGRVLLRKELLKKIVAYLDLDSMFSFGRTCRPLNDIVFASYINNTQPDTGYYGHNGGYLLAGTAHPEGLLTAFRCSLTLRTSLTSIAYGFLPNRGFQGLMRDLSELHTLFQRQPRAMKYVSLFFSQIDRGLKMTLSNEKALLEGGQFTAESFRDMLCKAMGSAIRKGTTFLDVNGGWDTLQMLPNRNSTPLPGPPLKAPEVHLGPKNPAENVIRQIASPTTMHVSENGSPSHGQITSKRRSLFSSISMHLRPSRSKRTPGAGASIVPEVVEGIENPLEGPPMHTPSSSSTSFNASSSIEELHIRTDMLLSPLFLSWTLDVLKKSAGTLQHLKFECCQTPSSTWHEIFNGVPLPRLKKLEIIVAPLLVHQQLEIDPNDIICFLSRCEAVEDVIFYGIRPGVPSPRALQVLHIPQLASFAGHPRDVLWVLKLCASLVPKLKRIVVTTEYYAGSLYVPFDHAPINDVLDVVDADGRELALGFNFNCEDGLETWMLDRVNLSRARCPLRQIRHLEISFSWYMNFSVQKLETVADFVNTFANVEHDGQQNRQIEVDVERKAGIVEASNRDVASWDFAVMGPVSPSPQIYATPDNGSIVESELYHRGTGSALRNASGSASPAAINALSVVDVHQSYKENDLSAEGPAPQKGFRFPEPRE
ncbi:hypothetical protein BKA70DRAFT_1562230 [Coprinopsis sp. MPI-PUGE-AT-0042]|nr:hypothetical protein BKA70DRAFT_1562230 [Coprinopsis sp. MPI-PUGE-AT-0042]